MSQKISEQTWEKLIDTNIMGEPMYSVIGTQGNMQVANGVASEKLAEAIAHLPDCVRLLKKSLAVMHWDIPIKPTIDEIDALLREIGEV